MRWVAATEGEPYVKNQSVLGDGPFTSEWSCAQMGDRIWKTSPILHMGFQSKRRRLEPGRPSGGVVWGIACQEDIVGMSEWTA